MGHKLSSSGGSVVLLTDTHSPGTVPLEQIERARERIRGQVLRTPLVRLNSDDPAREIYLKLENLQPTGSFKIRGASNAVDLAGPEATARGVYTCSAGNMAQALASCALQKHIPCTAIVPDNAPKTKLQAIQRYGAKIIQVPFDEVWKVATTRSFGPLADSVFVHPFSDDRMIAGNGTIGLEILEDFPDVDTVIVPFGGGGLTAGIASAIHAKKPETKVYAVEPETAAPLTASLRAGKPMNVERVPSFVDGIGAKNVLPEMFRLVKPLIHGSIVVSLKEIADAIRHLVERNRIIAEGAGAASVAAALTKKVESAKTICIVSGGNLDTATLTRILFGDTP